MKKRFIIIFTTLTITLLFLIMFNWDSNFNSVELMILLINTILFAFIFYLNYRRTSNLLDYINIFGVFFYFYTNSVYINNLFFDKVNYLYFGEMYYLTFASMAMYVFFSIGYNFSSKIRIRENNYSQDFKFTTKYILLLWIVFIIGLIMEYKVISGIGFSNFFFADRASRLLTIQGSGFLALYSDINAFVSITSFYLFIKYKDKTAGFLFMVSFTHNVIYGILTISRGDLLFQLIPILYILLDNKKIKKATVIYMGALTLVLFTVWKQLIPMIILNKSNQISFLGLPSEFTIWYEIGRNIVNDFVSGSQSLLYGKTYLDTFLGLLFPFYNFENLSVWYVKSYLSEIYFSGGGRGFSTIVESILNFGYAGVLFMGLFYGIIFARLAINRHRSDFHYLIYIFSLPYVYKLFRSEIYAVFKVYLWVYVFLAFLIFVLAKNLFFKRKRIN